MIIGLTGQLQSGKDTVGQYLVEKYGFERRAFADKLKDAYCALFDIDRELLETLKNEGYIEIYIPSIGEESGKMYHELIVGHSVRQSLQRFGTEMGREVFGQNFWVDLAMQDMDSHKNYVFTDCRFPNEAQAIYRKLGYVIQLVRAGYEDTDPNHVSEKGLPDNLIDLRIFNDGSLEDLYKKVEDSLLLLGRKS